MPAPTILGYDTRMAIALGTVGHFGLAVRDPKKSATWWEEKIGLERQFEFDDGVAIGNDNITIALSRGTPNPATFDHMSFHIADMKTLRAALDELERNGVEVEDPGDEIGPEAPGSKNVGIWFHDLDGYRWELSVQNGAAEKS